MSATNSTTHYSLPSFLGSDKPAWLVDWNGAMATIDSAIYEAKQAADTASASASAVASDLATLSGTVSTQGTSISTLSDTLTTAVGNINTINSLIGNGTPTTTDQTIIGAINEINARTGEADGISYDNTGSGLTATNVQDAIDENAEAIGSLVYNKYTITSTTKQSDIRNFVTNSTRKPYIKLTRTSDSNVWRLDLSLIGTTTIGFGTIRTTSDRIVGYGLDFSNNNPEFNQIQIYGNNGATATMANNNIPISDFSSIELYY